MEGRRTASAAETGLVAAEARTDERWSYRTNGGAARVTLVGAAGRVAFVAATGAVLLLAGIAATRAVLAGSVLPPWTAIALYGIAAAVAVAGMSITARLAGSAAAGRPAVADAAATTAPREPALRSPRPAGHPDGAASDRAPLERFQVETREGRRIIAAGAVEWFQARGNYARLHLADGALLYRVPLARLEQELDARFLRVHRSAIVNLDAIRRVEPLSSGDAELWLASGARVRLSRRYARAFHERTGRGH